MTPMALFALNMKAATLMAEAGTVMSLRMLAMAGVLPARRGENKRMVDEKSKAFMTSYGAAASAIMTGKSPEQIINASIAPYSRKVRANRKRLTRS